MPENKVMTLENMRDLSIEEIVRLYNNGYKIQESSLKTLQCNCSGPIFGSFLLGLGVGGLITMFIIKSAIKQ